MEAAAAGTSWNAWRTSFMNYRRSILSTRTAFID